MTQSAKTKSDGFDRQYQRRCQIEHVNRCMARAALVQQGPELLSRYPAHPSEWPLIVEVNSKPGVRPFSVHDIDKRVLNRTAKGKEVGCDLCKYKTHFRHLIIAHWRDEHGIYIPSAASGNAKMQKKIKPFIDRYLGGEWTLQTTFFPLPPYSYFDHAYHPDPAEYEQFCHGIYLSRIDVKAQPFTVDPAINGIDILPAADRGSHLDERYKMLLHSNVVVQQGICIACTVAPHKTWAQRMNCWHDRGDYRLHCSAHLRFLLNSIEWCAQVGTVERYRNEYATYTRRQTKVADLKRVERTGRMSTGKQGNAAKSSVYEDEDEESDQEVVGAKRKSREPLASKSVNTYKRGLDNGLTAESEVPYPFPDDKHLMSNVFNKLEGFSWVQENIICADPVCVKHGRTFDKLLDLANHVILVHQWDIIKSDKDTKNTAPSVRSIAFKDDVHLQEWRKWDGGRAVQKPVKVTKKKLKNKGEPTVGGSDV